MADYFHEFRDRFALLHRLERKAYGAIAKEDEAARKFAGAKSEANLAKRLQQYDAAHHACEQAMERYDQFALLLHWLREALQLCSPHGRLRTQENVRSDLMLLLDLIQALDCVAMTKTIKPLRKHVDDMLVPFKQAEVMATELRLVVPHDALDFLVLAWHHDHLIYQSGSKPPRYHQQERDFWLACAEGLLGSAFDTLKALVFDKLDTIIRASSLVEMVNSLIRPYLNSCNDPFT